MEYEVLIDMSDMYTKYREIVSQFWCGVGTSHLEMQPEVAEQMAKYLHDNSQCAEYWKHQARQMTDRVVRQAEQIKQLQAQIKEAKADGIEEMLLSFAPKNAPHYALDLMCIPALKIKRYVNNLRNNSGSKDSE